MLHIARCCHRSFAEVLASDTRSLKMRSSEEREERAALSREQQDIKEVSTSRLRFGA
jgi:hypothetical protein